MEKFVKTLGKEGLSLIAAQIMDITFNPIFTRVLSNSIETGVNTSISPTLILPSCIEGQNGHSNMVLSLRYVKAHGQKIMLCPQ